MLRRRLVLATVPLLMLLAGCGQATSSDPSGSLAANRAVKQIAGVTVTGKVGVQPKVTIDAPLKAAATRSQVIKLGTGSGTVVDGKQAALHLYLANGTSGKKIGATYGGPPAVYTVAAGQMWDPVRKAIVGKPAGSRVLVTGSAKDALGTAGAKRFQLANDDPVVFVVDVMALAPRNVLDGPRGQRADVPGNLPTVRQKNGDVTRLTFENAPARPADRLRVLPLVRGSGAPVRKGDLVTFDYLGQVYGTGKVFDQSYTATPRTFSVGAGGLIKAWDEGLIGVRTGSRVMIIAPPDYGYGAAGNPQAGIRGTDTLVFVVDVLGVS